VWVWVRVWVRVRVQVWVWVGDCVNVMSSSGGVEWLSVGLKN
jgi:hypothetical protein